MKRISSLWRKVRGTRRVSQLLILLSFLVTFLLSRLTVRLNSDFGIVLGDLRVHHLVPGIFLILISGYVGISYWKNQLLRWFMAILFGTGAALTIDEFALWLYLDDVYWQKEGRLSVDTIIIIFVLISIAFVLSERHDHREVRRFWRLFSKNKKV